ncbi:MAG TPA: hypothetical protein VNF50_01565 [Acidimicrobiales bacterium]|nr:hypothetical protein [Acidimicrobiales bacterium]
MKIEAARSVSTQSRTVRIETAGAGERSLVALTPIGTTWLARTLPAVLA